MILMLIIRFSISNENALDWTIAIHSQGELTSLPPFVNRLIFVDNGCNELSFTELDFSSFSNLKKIEVGSNSLLHVNRLMMNGLNKLTEVSIGEGSLNNTRELTIGSNSLNHVDLQSIDLKPFANLRTLSIGSNSLQSTQHILTSTMNDLQSFSVGSSSMINLIK